MTSQLVRLRALLRSNKLAAIVVTSADAHDSEYVAPAAMRRAYISSFTGSAGTAIVQHESAHLFTDGRYHLQAEQQLSNDWTLHRCGQNKSVLSWQEYLVTIPPSSPTEHVRIGLDPALITVQDFKTILPTLPPHMTLVPLASNLVDAIWDDQPSQPANAIFLHPLKWAGESTAAKLKAVRAKLVEEKTVGLVVNLLDEIAWILNLRGSDIAFNPVFFASLYVPTSDSGSPTLYVEMEQIDNSVYDYLMNEGILIESYASVQSGLQSVGKSLQAGEQVLVPSRTSLALAIALAPPSPDAPVSSLFSPAVLKVTRGPIVDLKAIKNAVELEGFRTAHARDGVALVRYFAWLAESLDQGALIDEHQGAAKLEEFRAQLPLFQGLSFDTISSSGPNASIIHYKPPSVNSARIDRDKIYLCDSGAQFSDGTTDTTRTLHFGTPTEREIRAYTRVLQGHIAIDSAVFPQGTTGYVLDVLARAALWKDGMNYAHGTSHGVGSFLCVHEGPQGVGTRIAYNDIPLELGMVISNEPGFYAAGTEEAEGFGIRIENVVGVVAKETRESFGAPKYLGFEHYTMCPISTNLVDATLLSSAELEWLNAYNAKTLAILEPTVAATGDEVALRWLRTQCIPLSRA